MNRHRNWSTLVRPSRRKTHPQRLRNAVTRGLEALEARRLLSVSVLGYHNDAASTGANLNETILTPANVNASTFGKLFSTPLDGQVYTQPTYVPGLSVTVNGQTSTHDVVFVGTEGDSLYALDAGTGAILWHDMFLQADPAIVGSVSVTTVPAFPDVNTNDINPVIGITATPAIDPATGFMYLTAKTKQVVNGDTSNPRYVYTLEKVNIHDGSFTNTVIGDTTSNGGGVYTYNSGPYVLDPAGAGAGVINVGGQNRVYFNALREMNRSAVTLYNGHVYMAFASHGDNNPYHGWILGFDENTLTMTAAFNANPNGAFDGIWQGGGRIAIDPQGFFYVETGNGNFDTTLNAQGFPVNGDYGDSFIKLALDSTTTQASQNINGWGLKVVDYFTPSNQNNLSGADEDLGSGGPMVLPDSLGTTAVPHLLVGAGKEGKIYLINRDNMGHYSSTTDHVVQEVSGLGGGGVYSSPALFFDGTTTRIYYEPVSSNAKSYVIANGAITGPDHLSPDTYSSRVGSPSISANGTANGIMWAINAANDGGTASLRAYNASDISQELWTSATNAARDGLTSGTKFSVPTIADGRVFVGTLGGLVGYGPIAPPTQPPAAPTNLNATGVSGVQINLSWQESDNTAAGFDIEQLNPTTGVWSQIAVASASATSFAVTGLTANTSYTFRVRAFNSVGNSPYTNTASASTLSLPPSLDFSGGFTSSNIGLLTLNSRNGVLPVISGTRLRLTDGGGQEASSAFSSSPINVQRFTTTFQFQLTTPTADGMTFTIQNAGSNALGAPGGSLGYGPDNNFAGIPTSVAVKFDLYPGVSTTGLYTDGAAPNDNAPQSIDMSGSGIDLHSGHVMQVTFFYDGTTLQETVTDTTTNAVFNQSYTIDIPGTVGASTAYVGFTGATGGATATQDILNWTYTPLPAPPATPTGLAVTPASGTELDLTWSETSTPVDHFNILKFVNGSYTQIAQVPGTQHMYADTGLTANTSYSYEVVASNAGGNSAATAPVSGTTPIAPLSPSNLVVTSATTTTVNLSWQNNATNATGIPITRQLESDNSQYVTTLPATMTSFADSGLLPGREYAYTIAAINAAGPSPGIDVVVETVPAAPTGLTATAGGDLVILNWTDSGHAVDRYNVYRSTTPGGEGATPIASNFHGTRYVDSGLTAGTKYYYKITAVDGGGVFTGTGSGANQGDPIQGGGESTTSAEVSSPANLPGDIDGNGSVGFSDLLLLAQHYGQSGPAIAGDINGDGTVNFADLLLLAQNYGRSLPAAAGAAVTPAAAAATSPPTNSFSTTVLRRKAARPAPRSAFDLLNQKNA